MPSRSSHEEGPSGHRPLARAGLIAAALSLGIHLFYFASYPLRGLRLPVGFDPPFWIWRAQYVASQGLGTGKLAARPGYPILSALLGALTGRSQVQMAVVLPLVLVAVLALAVGSLARGMLRRERGAFALAAVIAGLVAGSTQLVGENLSNLLNLTLAVAAFALLAARVGGVARRSASVGAVALLVSGGLAHWDFLALTLAALLLAVLFGRRGRAEGSPEAMAVAAVAGLALAIMAVAVFVVLRAPLGTVEVVQDPVLYRRFFLTDLVRLLPAWIAGLVCLPMVRAVVPRPDRRGSFLNRVLLGWTAVMVAGTAVGAATAKVPPARFLALLAVLPGAIGLAALCVLALRRVRPDDAEAGRPPVARRALAMAILGGVIAVLVWPAALRWFRYPVLMRAATLQQASTAASYIRGLPADTPVVFVFGYGGGKPGAYQSVVKERTVRVAMPAARQRDVHFFVGDPLDAVAGRRTPAPDPRTERITRPYWDDVRGVLRQDPTILALRDTGAASFAEARQAGAPIIGPGVALVRGRPPPVPLVAAGPQKVVPSWAGGLILGALLLAGLALAGAGWTRAVAGPWAAADEFAGLVPAVGAAALVLGGFLAGALGIHLSGGPAIASAAGSAACGYGVAFLRRVTGAPAPAARSPAKASG